MKYRIEIALALIIVFAFGYGSIMLYTSIQSAWIQANPMERISVQPRKPLTSRQMLEDLCPDPIFGKLQVWINCQNEIDQLFNKMNRKDI